MITTARQDDPGKGARMPLDIVVMFCTFLSTRDVWLSVNMTCTRWHKLLEHVKKMTTANHPLLQALRCCGWYFFSDSPRSTGFTRSFFSRERVTQLTIADDSGLKVCVKHDLGKLDGGLENPVWMFYRTHAVTQVFERRIFRFGGRLPRSDKRLRSCFVFDPATKAVSALPPLAQRRSAAAGVCVRNKVYVLGGFDGDDAHATYEVFDLLNQCWVNNDEAQRKEGDDEHDVNQQQLNSVQEFLMPLKVCEQSATVVQNRYVVMVGGCLNRSTPEERGNDAVWCLDVVTNEWRPMPKIPVPRILGAVISVPTNDDDASPIRRLCFVGGVSLTSNLALQPKPSESFSITYTYRKDDLFEGEWQIDSNVATLPASMNTVSVVSAEPPRIGGLPCAMVTTADGLIAVKQDSEPWRILARLNASLPTAVYIS